MIYTFKCNRCSGIFDEPLSIRDYIDTGMSRRRCPHCGKIITPVRVITIPTIVYNGNGFYVNDSKDSRGTNAEPS